MLTSVFIFFFSQLTNIVCQTKHMHASMSRTERIFTRYFIQAGTVVLWQEKSDDRGGQRVCVGGGGIYVILNLPDPNLGVNDKASLSCESCYRVSD